MKLLSMSLGAIIIFIALLLYGPFAWGLAIYKFWSWFVLYSFPNLPVISYIGAVGLGLFAIAIKPIRSSGIKKEYTDKSEMITASLLSPWIILLIGYFIHLIFF